MPFTDNAKSENVRGTSDCFRKCVKKIIVLKIQRLWRAFLIERDVFRETDTTREDCFWLVGNEKYLNGSFLLVQTSCEELCRCYLSGCCTLLFNMWGKANSQSRKPFEMLIHTQFIKDKEEGLAWGARPCPWGEELTHQALGEGTSEVTGEAGWKRAISLNEWDQGQWQWWRKWWGHCPSSWLALLPQLVSSSSISEPQLITWSV